MWRKYPRKSWLIKARKSRLGLEVVTGGNSQNKMSKTSEVGCAQNGSKVSDSKLVGNGSQLTTYDNIRIAQESVANMMCTVSLAESEVKSLKAFLKTTNRKLRRIEGLLEAAKYNAEEALEHIWNAVEILEQTSE